MNQVKQPTKCVNCAYEMEHPTVVVDGESFCCSGCAQGGPCICSYNEDPTDSGTNFEEYNHPDISSYDLDSPYSSAFARMVDNVLKEVEITQQVVKDQQGPVKDLLDLLQRTARLLQIMTYRLEDQRQARETQTPDWVSRIQSDVATRETEDIIKLFVQGLGEQDMVFCYTRALAKLPSVSELKLVNINGTDVCYQVHTNSKAKLARDIMSLPDYQPLRVHSTPSEITVLLNKEWEADAALGVTPTGDSNQAGTKPLVNTPTARDRSRSQRPAGGFMEAGIDGFFNARHFLVKDGEPGPVAMKSWRVEISLEGDQVSDSGQLEGVDQAKGIIEHLLAGYNNKLLNNIPPYDQIQPTPENIARTLYNQITAAVSDDHLHVKGLKVWVNPTQYVWYSESSGNAI